MTVLSLLGRLDGASQDSCWQALKPQQSGSSVQFGPIMLSKTFQGQPSKLAWYSLAYGLPD